MILEAIKEKALQGERLSLEDGLALYQDNDLLFLGKAARLQKERKSGKNIYYNVNRHINLTNICTADCPLCAFSKKEGEKGTFLLSYEDIDRILEDAKNVKNLGEIHIVSALHPTEPFDYYLNVVKKVKAALPDADIKAFTPVEIVHFAEITGKSVKEILTILKSAGLSSLPGGGAEILSDRVRELICPNKATSQEWLDTMETAHNLGIRTNATMLYGHLETVAERLDHLIKLRTLQDKTHGFQAFVAFPFHPQNTALEHLNRVGSWEDLKMLALFRLMLDNFDHIKAFWIMLTMPIAQLALAFGADDLDGTIGEEKIIHAAGAKTKTGITKEDLQKIIREADYIPVERDTFYNSLS